MKARNYLIAVAAFGLTALTALNSTADAAFAQYSSKPWLFQTAAGGGESRLVLMAAEVAPQQLASKPWLAGSASRLPAALGFEVVRINPSHTGSKPWLNPLPHVLEIQIAPLK